MCQALKLHHLSSMEWVCRNFAVLRMTGLRHVRGRLMPACGHASTCPSQRRAPHRRQTAHLSEPQDTWHCKAACLGPPCAATQHDQQRVLSIPPFDLPLPENAMPTLFSHVSYAIQGTYFWACDSPVGSSSSTGCIYHSHNQSVLDTNRNSETALMLAYHAGDNADSGT